MVWSGWRRSGRVGGKGANLGELLRAGLPVPPGSWSPAQAFLETLEEAGIRQELLDRIATAEVDDTAALGALAADLQVLVGKARPPPPAVRPVILAAHRHLGRGPVAVRSSATTEDTAGASFAGTNQTFTNVTGQTSCTSEELGLPLWWIAILRAGPGLVGRHHRVHTARTP